MKRSTASIVVGTTMAATLALAPTTALASPAGAGCQGLHEVARFATFRNGDTPGHQRVHDLLEQRGCGHHH